MRIFYLIIGFFFLSQTLQAQTTGSSGTGANIDVYNYQIWWRINPDSAVKAIKGVVMIKFKTTVPNVTQVSFDLSSLLTVTQVSFRGSNISLASIGKTGDSIVIPLGATIATVGTRDSITISYGGVPQNGTTGGGGIGYQKTSDPNAGNNIYTLAESYEDRDWWPCKADMQDKADTIDISVNVPWGPVAADTFWAATNGTLIDSTISGNSRTFKFINRYPMASYLVGICVARFNKYYRGTVNVSGFNTPIVYYLFAGKPAATYTSILAAMDNVMLLVPAFGAKYGPYPFADPVRGGKLGFYEGLGNNGGMEHQTFSGISTGSLTDKKTLAHELAHQWFGDKVSFSSWADLWLAEGFAKYSEALAPELVAGMGYTALSERNIIKTAALGKTTTSVTIPSPANKSSDGIWIGNYASTVYNRGAMVVSMLRSLSGDNLFFQALQNYQADASLAYKSATKADLIGHFNSVLGLTAPNDLTKFSKQFADSVGNPICQIGYQITGNKIEFTVANVTKTAGCNVIDTFQQPIFVHIKGASSGDTSVVFFSWGGNRFSKAGNGIGPIGRGGVGYNLSFTPDPTKLSFDDSLKTMAQPATVSFAAMSIVDLDILEFNARRHSGYNDATLILDNNPANTDVILERSADGVTFFEVGNMILQAGTTAEKKYMLNDMTPGKADNYYRAKYKLADGSYKYSEVIKLGLLKEGGFNVLTNPVSDLLQIKTADNYLNTALQITVYDASSRLVLQRKISNATKIIDIPVSELSAGVYVAAITSASGTIQNIKFIRR